MLASAVFDYHAAFKGLRGGLAYNFVCQFCLLKVSLSKRFREDGVSLCIRQRTWRSFLVHMQLGQGAINVCGSHFWRVAARVINEDGQFVVDDVRVFDCFSTDGPSRLLSDSFTGCDGPRWTGLTAPQK